LFSPQDFFLATGNPNATARKKYCAKKKTILAPRKIFVNHSVKKIYFSLRKHFCGCTIFKTIHFRYYLTVMSCVIRVCGECSLLIKRRNARGDLSTTASPHRETYSVSDFHLWKFTYRNWVLYQKAFFIYKLNIILGDGSVPLKDKRDFTYQTKSHLLYQIFRDEQDLINQRAVACHSLRLVLLSVFKDKITASSAVTCKL